MDMNNKKIIIVILAAVLGVGFLLGIWLVPCKRIELAGINSDIQVLRNEVSILSEEIKTPCRTDSPAGNTTQAKKFFEQGNIEKASLYFGNAIHKSPENWVVLQEYINSVLLWSEQKQVSGEHAKAVEALDELELFLKARAFHIGADDIGKLETFLDQLAEQKRTLATIAGEQQHNNAVIQTRKLIDESERLLKRGHQKNLDKAESFAAFFGELTDKLSTLQTIGELPETSEKLNETADALIQRLDKVGLLMDATVLHQQLDELLDSVQKASESKLAPYYLSIAQSTVQQLALLQPKIHKQLALNPKAYKYYTKQIESDIQRLDDMIAHVASFKSQTIWSSLKKQRSEFKALYKAIPETKCNVPSNLKGKGICHNLIAETMEIRRYILEKMQMLRSPEYVEKARKLISEIEEALLEWQKKQRKGYEKWAVKKVKTFHDKSKSQLDITTNTNEYMIREGLRGNLGRIDTRYLSIPGSTLYNEVFSIFYNELEDEQKINLSAEMAIMLKFTLEEF